MPRSHNKIVHLSSVHKASDPRIYEKECTTLSRAGYDVALIATGEGVPGTNFPVLVLPRPRGRMARMAMGTGLAVLRAIRMRPDVVHLHDPELIPWVPLLRALRIRVVFDSHEDIAATMLHKPYLGPFARRTAASLSRLLVRFVDHAASGIVAATPSIARAYRNKHQCVVQNYPIIEDWAPAQAAEETSPRLVYIGGITEGRGAWQMLDALKLLHESHGATLALAGPMSEALHRELQRHPAWPYVEYLGVLPRAAVSELLRRCTLGLVLFLPLPNHVRSQPTKMFEYMAAGLPVLASDFPLWREVIEQAGIGVVATPTSPEAIATAAQNLLNQPDKARRMGRHGRFIVEQRRNWANEGQVLLEFYQQLLSC